MQLIELADYRIWFAVGVLMLFGLLAMLHYRLRCDFRRNLKQFHLTLGSMRRLIEEDRASLDLYRRSLGSEVKSAAKFSRAEVEYLNLELEAFRQAVEADIDRLADVVVNLDARSFQGGAAEQISLFTLRADVEKLRSEVAALHAARGARTLLPQQAANHRPRLPRTEQVLAALDERRGNGLPTLDDPKIVN